MTCGGVHHRPYNTHHTETGFISVQRIINVCTQRFTYCVDIPTFVKPFVKETVLLLLLLVFYQHCVLFMSII